MRRLTFVSFVLVFPYLTGQEPDILYLTFAADPCTSMTVQWHTGTKEMESVIWYKKEAEKEWQQTTGDFLKPEKYDVLVHRVDLSALDPGTVYQFQTQSRKKTYKFRTLPVSLEEPIKFVVGGDSYRFYTLFKKMVQQVAKKDPDFVIIGGDIAYTYGNHTLFKGKNWEMRRWETFFLEWKKNMVTSDGRMIPLMVVVGNHDVPKGRKLPQGVVDPRKKRILFYELFAMAEPNVSYRSLDVGSYMTLLLLDTNHSYPIEGEQTEWLETTLKSRSSSFFKMAIYHVGAFPSVYPYDGAVPVRIRQSWCPLFEKYGVQVAFENHSHAYKRTFPIKQEKVDPAGVVYIGDGCWGVIPRKPVSAAWYLERKEGKNCFSLISVSQEGYEVTSFDNKGKIIDAVPTVAFSPSLVN